MANQLNLKRNKHMPEAHIRMSNKEMHIYPKSRSVQDSEEATDIALDYLRREYKIPIESDLDDEIYSLIYYSIRNTHPPNLKQALELAHKYYDNYYIWK